MDDKTITRFLRKGNFHQPGAEHGGTLCLVWRGTRRQGRASFVFTEGGHKTNTTPRQFAFWLGNGRKRAPKQRLNMLCGIEDCCRFSHMEPK